jgi:hypothetical protein
MTRMLTDFDDAAAREHDAPVLSPQDLATTRVLRAAFAVLGLGTSLEPGLFDEIPALRDLIAASRRVIDELGFGDDGCTGQP